MSEKGQGDFDSAGPADDAGDDAPETRVRVDPGLALDQTGNEILLELRSELILDQAGGATDADSVGSSAPPTGGTPGGGFDDGPRAGAEDTDPPKT